MSRPSKYLSGLKQDCCLLYDDDNIQQEDIDRAVSELKKKGGDAIKSEVFTAGSFDRAYPET